jgi:hypothetical protein
MFGVSESMRPFIYAYFYNSTKYLVTISCCVTRLGLLQLFEPKGGKTLLFTLKIDFHAFPTVKIYAIAREGFFGKRKLNTNAASSL